MRRGNVAIHPTARSGILLSAMLALTGGWGRGAQAETVLIENGRPKAEIVVSERAAAMTKVAAGELQESLETMTGARLPIVTAPTEAVAVKIFVGPSAFTEKLGIKAGDLEHDAYRTVSGGNWLALVGRDIPFFQQRGKTAAELLRLAALKFDNPKREELWTRWYALSGGKWGLPYSQLWKDYNKELGVWAEDEHGSFNAVADFLRSLGMRWYMPGALGQVIPKRTSVVVPMKPTSRCDS